MGFGPNYSDILDNCGTTSVYWGMLLDSVLLDSFIMWFLYLKREIL